MAQIQLLLSMLLVLALSCLANAGLPMIPDEMMDSEAAAAGAKTTASSSVEEQIKAIGDEMFADSANRLGYEDMIQRLQKLSELFDQLPSSGETKREAGDDMEIEDVSTITAVLIQAEASIGDDPSCPVDSTQVVAKMRFYVEKYQGYGPNVRNFLEHLIRRIISECGNEVEKVVGEELDPETRDMLKKLNAKLNQALRQSRSPVHDALELLESPAGSRAVIGYIQEMESDDEGSDNDSGFDEQYERDVEKPCRAVLLYLEGPTEVIRNCPAPEQLNAVDEEAIQWAQVYEACTVLDSDQYRLHAASQIVPKPIKQEMESDDDPQH